MTYLSFDVVAPVEVLDGATKVRNEHETMMMHTSTDDPAVVGVDTTVEAETGFFTGTFGTIRQMADMPR